MDKVIGCEQIAIEGYSMGSKGKVFNIAENTGVLKYKIYKDLQFEILEKDWNLVLE